MPIHKILLVDDDRAINFLHRIILKDNNINCAVDEALNGEQALDYIAATDDCPDIILLDINMPGIDGFAFLKEYTERGKCCDKSKVFMLTSSQRDEDRATADKFHISGYLDKPLNSSHIEEILTKVS